MKFKKGKSGNPKGRPKGIPDKRAALRELLEPHAEELVKKALERALDGDNAALKLCLDRSIAPFRPRSEPAPFTAAKGSLTDQGQAIIDAIAAGELAPDEAASILQALAAQARITEIDELEKRITVLENQS